MRVLRPRLVGLALAAAAGTACAAIMGVEEPTLAPAAADDAASPTPVEPQGNDGGEPCVGAGCGCKVDGDCTDPVNKKCVAGTCAECTTDPDSCPLGRYCLAGSDASTNAVNACAPGCTTDDGCKALSPAAPYCDPQRHQCVACRGKADCPNAGQDCSPAGLCADTCRSDGGSCPTAGDVCCGGFCVDPSSDVFNCNGCGKKCGGSNPLCCAGACKAGLTDVQNCGQCGLACLSGAHGAPSCAAGSCKWNCDKGFSHCATGNTGCETSTSDSLTQCGSCTTSCTDSVKNATGVACTASLCTYATCNGGFFDCNGRKSDGCECNCGAVGAACCATDPRCSPNLYCGTDSTCHTCKGHNAPCSFDAECCNGATYCAGNGMCK
jgi:hypothetical protein